MRILVIGDLLLDRDIAGGVQRIAPDAPVPVLDVDEITERPGGAGLAATLLGRDGIEVVLATVLGTDEAGAAVAARVPACIRLVPLATCSATRTVTRFRSHGQSLLRADQPGERLTRSSPIDVPALKAELAVADCVLVSDYGGGLTSVEQVRRLLAARRRQTSLVWDPHPRGEQPIAGTTVVTPNRNEAALFATQGSRQSGIQGSIQGSQSQWGTAGAVSPMHLAGLLLRRWQAEAVAVTAGASGVFTASAGSTRYTPVGSVCPGDAVGAGDRFAGTVAAGLAAGQGIDAAVDRAVADVTTWLWGSGVGSVDTGLQGGAHPVAHDGLRDGDDPGGLGYAFRLAERVRRRGGTVVATGGCFDLLHAGHLASLHAARAMGDVLIVLLNSDASVRRIKGPERPITPVADRKALLQALDAVDAVAVFDQDTPIEALRVLRPRIWAKGGDYAEAGLPEAAALAEWGGRAVLLPYLVGRSTTNTLNRLKEAVP